MFSDNLRKIRRSKHLTQKELADKLNVAQTAIASYEIGKRNPTITTIYKYCIALDCDFFDLLPASDILEGLENAKKSFKRSNKN